MNNFVVYIGDVHHMTNCVSGLAQKPPQHIHCHKCPEISDVPIVVHRGSARVHPNLVVPNGLELFHFSGQRIVKTQRHGSIGLQTESLIVGGRKK
jgi:hypothetical protein